MKWSLTEREHEAYCMVRVIGKAVCVCVCVCVCSLCTRTLPLCHCYVRLHTAVLTVLQIYLLIH